MNKSLLLISILIIGIIIIYISFNRYSTIQDEKCYNKCADIHLLGEATHWDYNDFVIDSGDTIWVDEECYNDWCICIDECNPGLCCEFLK
ncbi:MAG: hypothetical protein H8E85_00860 [Candidatus Marinimicrobia bacterium]|nr:hypothetical protein [Candidatus Neomarinimicrobiota bacterium]